MRRLIIAVVAIWLNFAAGIAVGVGLDSGDVAETKRAEGLSAECHSSAEDSTIYDCDYNDGGWYPNR